MPEQLEKQLVPYEKENITMPELHTEVTAAKERRKGGDTSRRMYQCLYHITLILKYTYSVNPPPFVEDISSVNTKVSRVFSILVQYWRTDLYPLKTVERSRFWAVIIGIDGYKSSPLRGCVSDALLVEKYLMEEIGVTQERIQGLLGSQDTSSDGPSSRPAPILSIRFSVSLTTLKSKSGIITAGAGRFLAREKEI